MLEIVPAETEEHYRQLRELMAELTAWDTAQVIELGLDAKAMLDFYYRAYEETLPGDLAPPEGCLLFATYSAKPAGCAGFHRMTAEVCEMKRMYVRPEFRRSGVGRELVRRLIEAARAAGYGVMRLETTTFMHKAIALYSALGFRTCEPYYVIPESFRPITVFMDLNLRAEPPR